MPTKTKKRGLGVDLWNQEIEPFIAMARSRRGFLSRVVDRLNEQAAREKHPIEFRWQHVSPYFADDRNRRVEPRAGLGMVLLTACDGVAKETEDNQNQNQTK